MEELLAINADLRLLLKQRDDEIRALTEAVAKLSDRVAELLVMVQQKRRPPAKPPKEPSPAPAVSEEEAVTFADRPLPPPPPPPPEKPTTKASPTGRKPLPKHLPTDETTLVPARCGQCAGSSLTIIDEVVEEKLDVRAHHRRRLTRRKTCRCRDCGARTTAEAPPSPFQGSKVTCEWLAWLVVQKFQLLVPLDRVRRYLGLQGLTLSMSFLVSQVEAAATLLDAIDGVHWKILLEGTHLASDATGFKVQVPKAGLHHGHIEVFHWGDVAVFQYEPEKGGATLASKLKRFKGTLLVDAESRHNEVFTRSAVVEAGCNAHGRRKFRDAQGSQPVLAAEGGRFIAAWFDADEQGRRAGLVGEALQRWRSDRIRPLTNDFRRWMDAVEPTLPPDDEVAKVIRYYRNHWGPLTRFLEDGDLPLDNSASEREFQHVAKLRLNSLFAGGTEGAHRAAVLLGIASTCRRLGVDLQAYLTWAFVRLGTHAAKYELSAAELTPAAYKRAHPSPS